MLVEENNQIFYLRDRKKVNVSLLLGDGRAEILYGFDLKYPGTGDSYVEMCFNIQPPPSQKWIRVDSRRWRRMTRIMNRDRKKEGKTNEPGIQM